MPRKLVTKRSFKVTRITGASAPLVEIDAESPLWLDFDEVKAWNVNGSIAKVTPPADVSNETIDELERMLYANGAVAVRVMPSAPSDKLHAKVEQKAPAPNRSLRQVAMERAQRVSNSHDHPALLALVAKAMDHGEQSCT